MFVCIQDNVPAQAPTETVRAGATLDYLRVSSHYLCCIEHHVTFFDQNILPKPEKYTSAQIQGAWHSSRMMAENESQELVAEWNKEIDGLLTFIGLFSAALTAFNTISFAFIQPQTNSTSNATVLQAILQLRSVILDSSLASSSPVIDAALQSPTHPPSWTVWVNALWFTSLTFSLSSATMAKQWLKEHRIGVRGSSADIARLRMYRLMNLQASHIAIIVALVPLLLIAALVLFFAGLLILLFHANKAVFSVTFVFVGILLLFVIGTTVLPIIDSTRCYFSPQAQIV
ncbi:uncharacterized protein BXZ73DRAFT_44061, partial [Epithele typhae]|uniref:uncharacterized protein n=1 Tax=Epithele typhae TaxID=378194 RepID=UPI0020084322